MARSWLASVSFYLLACLACAAPVAQAATAPPVIIKAFGAASVPVNGSTSLTFTIQNNNPATPLTGVGFTDTFPSGLVVANPVNLTGSCGGGTITATAGSGAVSLSGSTIAANSSCSFAIDVTGTAAGQENNTTGNVVSNEGGTGGTASASVSVLAPPSIATVFNPASISVGAATLLDITITNPNATTTATGVGFSDTLPTGLTVVNASLALCGGTLTLTNLTNTIVLSGAAIAAGTPCHFGVTVSGAAAGFFTNTTGAVTSTNGGTGNSASANLTVVAAPTITKAFGSPTLPLNATTTLTFTITNPNAGIALSGVAFNDSFPSGIVVATPANLTNTCGGTTVASSGSGTTSLAGGTLAAAASCTVTVDVQGQTPGVKNNSVQVSSTEGGSGNTANATITVVAPPVIIKAFGAASVPLSGTTSLTFIIQNNNLSSAYTGVTFTDAFPAGLLVATPANLSGSCGVGTISAVAGSSTVSLSGGSIAANTSCTFAIDVTGASAGTKNNTTGQVSSTEGGTGGTASASVSVLAPPSIATVFNPASISVGAATLLDITITNPNATTTATGVGFSDTLPIGLTVMNASAALCGGTLTLTNLTNTIVLSGAAIAAGTPCHFGVTVTGQSQGTFNNATSAVTSTNGGTGNTATATLQVIVAPPVIIKAFGASSVPLNGTTSLTFIIQNNNAVPLTGVAFTDTFPAGLIVATPNNLTGSCGAGSITVFAGSGPVLLSGGTIAANSSCTFSLDVTGATAGVKNNTTGQVSSTEGGTGGTASASLTVLAPPSIATVFSPASIAPGATTLLNFTITNPNTTVAATGVAFADTLPAGLTVANASVALCGGTLTVTAPGSIALSGAAIAPSAQCVFGVTVTGTLVGSFTSTTGTVTSTNGGTGNAANATLTVAPPSTTTLTSSTNPSQFGQSVTFTATVASGAPPVSVGVPARASLPRSNAIEKAAIAATPTGTVTFADGGALLGAIALNPSGVATFSTATLSVGTHTITATYGGDAATQGSVATLVQQVDPQAAPVPASLLDTRTLLALIVLVVSCAMLYSRRRTRAR